MVTIMTKESINNIVSHSLFSRIGDAGCGSGTLRLRRTIPLLFGEKSLKTVCFDSFIFKTCSSTDAQRLFKSFLTRNELVDSQKRVIFAG